MANKEQGMSDFKKGDVVRLNSGGPAMTVVQYYPNHSAGPSVTCVWFYDNTKPSEETFVVDALKPV